MSAIAHWDWPEEWPELFEYLIQMLAEGSPHAVHGAMRVLTGTVWEVFILQINMKVKDCKNDSDVTC